MVLFGPGMSGFVRAGIVGVNKAVVTEHGAPETNEVDPRPPPQLAQGERQQAEPADSAATTAAGTEHKKNEKKLSISELRQRWGFPLPEGASFK